MLKKSLNLLFLVLGISLLNVSAQTDQKIKTISKGVVNGSAVSLPKPVYPAAAKAVRAGGTVNVQVTIDEQGNVIAASAVSGHPLLRQASETAARAAKFKGTLLEGVAVKVNGVIVYNFVPPPIPAYTQGQSNTVTSSALATGIVGSSDNSARILNGQAANLVKPAYPAAARALGASGTVMVKVSIDEEGNVVSAEAVSGHELLRDASEQAALGAKFSPTLLQGIPVKVRGVIVYNFVP